MTRHSHMLLYAIALILTSSLLSCSKSGTENLAIKEIPNSAPSAIADRAALDEDKKSESEKYPELAEQEFLDVKAHPTSTFSIDVDNASYTNVRRFITQGTVPPTDAVRIEEMVNYFNYEYPKPKEGEPFTMSTELVNCPWNKEHYVIQVGLKGKEIAMEKVPASNLVFLIDVSGSMADENKLGLLKKAFKMLADQMRPEDNVAIVTYAGREGLALPSTSGDKKDEIKKAIDNLESGGSTNGGAGILLAYKVAAENLKKNGNNRVILATDGDFNVGVTNDSELITLIEMEREKGIDLSCIGVGMGNYSDKNMEAIADHGNGNYYYFDNLEEAKRVFSSQFAGTMFTIAKDVKLQVAFNPQSVKSYRLIGYDDRRLDSADFTNDKKDAGDMGAGHTVTALYEIIPQPNSKGLTAQSVLTFKARYKEPGATTSKELANTLAFVLPKEGGESMNAKFATAVAEFGLILRDSKYKGSASLEDVKKRASEAATTDLNGQRKEFLELVDQYAALKKSS